MSRQKFIEAISALDARADDQARNYFVDTHLARRLREQTKGSVGLIGLKGAGKTTLFRALTEGWVPESDVITIPISPTTSEFEASSDKINCLQVEQSVRRGMAIMLLSQLVKEGVGQHPKFSADWIRKRSALLNPSEKVGDVLRRFTGLSILGCGIEWNGEKGRAGNFQLTPQEDTKVLDLLKEAGATGIKVRVVLDDPDRLFTRAGQLDANLMAGYILGTRALEQSLNYVSFVNIMKGQAYEAVRDIEEIANLPHDYFAHISWTQNELNALVDSRMKFANVSDADVFAEPKEEKIAEMSLAIRNGPRDLLRFMEIILKNGGLSQISSASIEDCRAEFKAAARMQMRTVYSQFYEGIEAFAAHILGSPAGLDVAAFRVRFAEARMATEPPGVDYKAPWLKSAAVALRALVEAGVVDVLIRGAWARPFEADYFRFDQDEPGAKVRLNAVFG